MEEGPEKRDEEHHFRGDKQNHAIAQADLGDFVVHFFLNGFENNILPPEKHTGQNSEQPDRKGGCPDIKPVPFGTMHEKNGAHSQQARS